MLYKESAIAVMIAVMLGAASLFGGLSIMPALATHDPSAVQVASETISQGETESTVIDALELTAKKSTSRASGTITIEIIQDNDVLRSATLSTSSLTIISGAVEVDVTNIEVTGSFEILVEYFGSGVITVTNIDLIDGTEVAEEENPTNNEEPAGDQEPESPPEQEFENVIASKTVAPDDDDGMTVNTVEFAAKKSTSRASGTLTIAIVQDNVVLDSDQMDIRAFTTFLEDMEASFDIEVTGDFEVLFMYEGSGVITLADIGVPGATETAEEPAPGPGPGPAPSPSGTIQLTVNSVNQNNEPITGLWVALLQGMTLVESGETEEIFTLNSNEDYIVEMGDFYDDSSATLYDFNGWVDSTAGNRRPANDLTANEEFTAKYIVTTGAPPPAPPPDPPSGPPASSPPGTITAYAYRIPHEKWGNSTFVGANAQMYFVLYDSTGKIVFTGFFDENGNTVTGLKAGQTYWVSPTDCHHCHGGTHDVVFHHWDDGSTERQRPVTPGHSVGAYYEYVPDTP